MRTEYILFVYHVCSFSTWWFEHSCYISCSLLVNPSHTDESWEGRNTCLWIYICIDIYLYIYIYIYIFTKFLPIFQVSSKETILFLAWWNRLAWWLAWCTWPNKQIKKHWKYKAWSSWLFQISINLLGFKQRNNSTSIGFQLHAD